MKTTAPIPPPAEVSSAAHAAVGLPARTAGGTPACGIYGIWCIKNEKWYVGQSKNMPHRWAKHERSLAHNQHVNPILQAAWNCHGPDAFLWVCLELCLPEQRNERELFYARQLSALYPFGFTLRAGDWLGEMSQTTRRKISAAKFGRPSGRKGIPIPANAIEKQRKTLRQKWQIKRLADGLPDGHKRCSKCHAVFPYENFSPSKKCIDGRYPYCRECGRKMNRKYHATHKRIRPKKGE